MRTMPRLISVLGLVVVATGCVLSVDPVIPESGAAFDPRLIGAWQETPGSDFAVITPKGPGGYAIQYTTAGRTGAFEARLGRLGDRLVLDVWPTPGEKDLPEPYGSVVIAGHALFSLDVTTDEIRLSPLDPDAMLKALRAGDLRLDYSSSADRLVLLSATSPLRAEMTKYLARPGAFGESSTWRRATPRPGVSSSSLLTRCAGRIRL